MGLTDWSDLLQVGAEALRRCLAPGKEEINALVAEEHETFQSQSAADIPKWLPQRMTQQTASTAHAPSAVRTMIVPRMYTLRTSVQVLTNTGASSNYVISLDIPTERNPDYWVRMGVAGLCALAE